MSPAKAKAYLAYQATVRAATKAQMKASNTLAACGCDFYAERHPACLAARRDRDAAWAAHNTATQDFNHTP